jgi:hypothetical protein
MTGPIFIGGSSRSGKTLVRWALSAHSRLAISRRLDLWPLLFRRYGDLSHPPNLERCLASLLARPKVAALQLDLGRLRMPLPPKDAGYAALFARVHEQFAARHSKARWGDQTETIGRFADQIMDAYPGARMIHMIRDPRDCYEAQTARGTGQRGGVARSTAAWCRSAEIARRNSARYPAAYRVVLYEALVADPERTLRGLCDFLGECYEPAMARLEGAARYDAPRAADPRGIPISHSFVGRYRDRVCGPELAYIQRRTGAQLASFGYSSDPIRLSSPEQLRYAAALPLNLAVAACPGRRALTDRSKSP